MDSIENFANKVLAINLSETQISKNDQKTIKNLAKSIIHSHKPEYQKQKFQQLSSLINQLPAEVTLEAGAYPTKNLNISGQIELNNLKKEVNALATRVLPSQKPRITETVVTEPFAKRSSAIATKDDLANPETTKKKQKQEKPLESHQEEVTLHIGKRQREQVTQEPRQKKTEQEKDKQGAKREKREPEILPEDLTKGIFRPVSSKTSAKDDALLFSPPLPLNLAEIVGGFAANPHDIIGEVEERLKNGESIESIKKSVGGITAQIDKLDLRSYPGKIKNISRVLELFQNVKTLIMPRYMAREDFEAISKLRLLQSLDLSNCNQIADTDLDHLKTLTELRHLDLSGCNITNNCLDYIKTHTLLQSLSLRNCSAITDFSFLTDLTSLRSLDLSECHITDEIVHNLRALTSLQSLSLSKCSAITDFSFLIMLESLQSLDLSYCSNVTDYALGFIKTLTSLQSLNLSLCNLITNDGLDHIKTLTSLQSLNLSHCSLITNDGLDHIKILTLLQSLDLSHCDGITDDGLNYLKALTSLKSLRLIPNGTTHEARDRLEKHLGIKVS